MRIEFSPQLTSKVSGIVSRGVKAVEVNASGHLIFTLSDNSTEDLGPVVGPPGPAGDDGIGVPVGGTASQVLKKKTDADYDTEWGDESTGTTDFDDLTNRPSYNGTPMTHSTNIPEVKTAEWDGKVDKAQGAANKWLATDDSGNVTDKDLPVAVQNRSPGLVGVYSDYGLNVNASGTITARTMTAEQYALNSGSMVLGKGTLENIKDDFLSEYRTASAQDIIDAALDAAITEKYTKPTGGIPASDIEEGVIPTALSQLTGDTTHRTVTDAEKTAWNGKADKVQSATSGNLAALDGNGNLTDSGKKPADFATPASVESIEAKISDAASSTNKLVSASEMGDAIASVEAKQLYATAAQGSFATKAALLAATTFYGADGSEATPTKNDVAYVLADESHGGKSAKYVIASVDPIVWGFVITFSDTTFTQAQMDALNSGATQEKIDAIAQKQPKITASGLLKGNGSGGVSAAVAGTDYQAPITFSHSPNDYVYKINGKDISALCDASDNEITTTYATKSELDGKLSTTGNGSNVTAAFTQATTRANIATGEKLSVLFGKIAKWYADLKTVAFTGSYNDLSNKPTIPTVPTNVSAFTNDVGYLTSHQSLAAYRTAAAQDTIDAGKVPTTRKVNGKPLSADITLVPSDLGIGSVFQLKGSKPTYADLPSSGNTIGDVWYVVDESVGYIWLNDGTSDRWEQLGMEVDLSAYRTASAQDTIDNGKENKGKITIDSIERTAVDHEVTIVTNGVTTTFTLVGVTGGRPD